MNHRWPTDIATSPGFESVDGPALLAAAAALQLLPGNVHALLRLQRLAAVAVRWPAAKTPRALSSSIVKRLLKLDDIGGSFIRSQEDPYEGIFVLEIPFFGGPALVLQGQATDAGNVASALLRGIFRAPSGTFPDAFLKRAHALTDFLLRLSDRVCRESKLVRGDVPPDDRGAIFVPSARQLSRMSGALQFSVDDLFLDAPASTQEFLLRTLARKHGDARSLKDEDLLDDDLIIRPLIVHEGVLTVAAPTELMACLRHHLVLIAARYRCTEALAEALLRDTQDRTHELIRGIADGVVEATEPDRGIATMRVSFDKDKSMSVVVLADDLSAYDTDSPFGTWHAAKVLQRAFDHRLEDVSSDRQMTLVIYQGVGRDLMVGHSRSDRSRLELFCSYADLETLLQSPGTNELSLWYFAEALKQLQRETRVVAFSTIDLYATYRDNSSSFYMSDDRHPASLYVEVAYGQTLRASNFHRLDPRHVVHPKTNALVPAYSMHGRHSSPIYMSVNSAGTSMIVDLDDFAVWVHVSREGDDGAIEASDLFDIAEAAAFWCWQICLLDAGLLRTHAVDGVLQVTVQAVAESSSDRWVECHVASAANWTLSISALPPSLPDSVQNAEDRDIARVLLTMTRPAPGPDEAARGVMSTDALDEIAPPGPKQMLQVIRPNTNPLAWPGRLTEAWYLDDHATSRILDELGVHLVRDQHLNRGSVPPENRVKFLNEVVVRWLIDQLGQQIAKLNPADLLEQLVERSESLIASAARESISLPSRLACFGLGDEQANKIETHQRSATISMLASRFLVEYATGLPPAGEQPLTRESYERLLALSAEIINKGMLSDSTRLGLSGAQLSVLNSGRLGISREDDAYTKALDGFARARAESTLLEASVTDAALAQASSQALSEIDDLALGEFGFSYSELARACGKLVDLIVEIGEADVAALPERDVEAWLSAELLWDDLKLKNFIARLVLAQQTGAVDDFWAQGSAVWPWRFNRELSYTRRPLLRLETPGEPVLVMGRRALLQTPNFWVHQFMSGRLQASSAAMKKALGSRTNLKGERFELTVAKRLQELGYSSIRTRLRRVGKADFRNINGENLGDIDVVAVDERARELLLFEAKDLEAARTPAELSNEVASLAGGPRSAVRRLEKRAEWIAAHRAATLSELNVPLVSGKWSVRSIVVVNEPLLSVEYLTVKIPLVAFRDLTKVLNRR